MVQPGAAIGPYILVSVLGRGAFGEVWLAERRSSLLTTQVALKLPLHGAADLDLVQNEAQVWLRASGHPNVVPVLEAEVYDGQVVVASEFVAGGSLQDWLSAYGAPGARQVPLEAAAGMMLGILRGLQHLHEAGLVHRDLKPDNVLVQKGIPRLTDFGLTRVLRGAGQSAMMAGTPAYMAPEAFRGRYSVESDVWAAGVLLHELLAGGPPFSQTDFYPLLLEISGDEPVAISDLVPEALRPVLAKALAKDAAHRFASAAEMTEALSASARVQAGTSRAGGGDGIDGALPGLLPPGHTAASAHTGVRMDAPPDPPRSNLPVQMTSFIGRERVLAEVKALLSGARLVTLTGSAGTGKTRLLLQAAGDLAGEYRDGVWLVELAPLADPGLVAQVVATVLNVREEPGRPLLQTLVQALKPRKLLLLLDNCEHLLYAAAVLAEGLLTQCPELSVLASSRESLGTMGERTYRVPSLNVPSEIGQGADTDVDALLNSEAARLFVDRATLFDPAFVLTPANAGTVARLCRRLDGIPLALELAAARIPTLPVEQIEARLHDRFRLLTGGSRTSLPRHQTLRALIDWSYDLLSDHEKTLLNRLSVFAGGWTLEAAETVASGHKPQITSADVLDLLTGLVAKSLVVADEARGARRYRLLETVRQYARDRLMETGDAPQVRHRHMDWFLEFAEQAEVGLRGAGQREWLDRLEIENDNLRAARQWSLESGSAAAGLRYITALQRFWYARGHFSEGREFMAEILALPECAAAAVARPSAPDAACPADSAGRADTLQVVPVAPGRWEINDPALARARAMAMSRVSILANNQGDSKAARDLVEEAVSLARALDDRPALAHSLNWLGCLLRFDGHAAAARPLLEESLALWRHIDDQWERGWPLLWLGHIAVDDGDPQQATQRFQECLGVWRDLGDRWGSCFALQGLGRLASLEGNLPAARSFFQESLELARSIEHKPLVSISLSLLADIAERQGDLQATRQFIEGRLPLLQDLGPRTSVASNLCRLAGLARRQGDRSAARTYAREGLTAAKALGDATLVAELLEQLGSLAGDEGDPRRAARLFGTAEALRGGSDPSAGRAGAYYPTAKPEGGSAIAADQGVPSREAFAADWAGGRSMTQDEAIRYALEGDRT